jgi:hypothetical protein
MQIVGIVRGKHGSRIEQREYRYVRFASSSHVSLFVS